MALWFSVTRLVTGLNLAVLVALSYVWLRNYRTLRTRFTLGFLVFGGFLLLQNGYALYIYAVDPTTSEWFANIPSRYNVVIMLLTVLQFGALGALAWLTLE